MEYRVMRIDEDVDFGCEERPEGSPVMAFVILMDRNGSEQWLRVPDQDLYDQNIREGDMVRVHEDGSIEKL